MVSTSNEDRTDPSRHLIRNYDAPCQRPWREIPPDMDAITEWTAQQERARAAYYAATAPPTAYDERVARAMAQRRYRARKVEQ